MELLLINDIPLSAFGAVLAPDSYKSALTWPKFKSIETNDWAEYNYAEPDLSNPKLDKRNVTLNFHCLSEFGYTALLNYLLQYVFSFYNFPELDITLKMRIDTNSLKNIGKWDSFSITFVDCEPYMQVSPSLSAISLPKTGYELDELDLSAVGISILDGTMKSVIQKMGIKERLTINERSFNGAIYDGEAYPNVDGLQKSKVGTFVLKCLLRAQNLAAAVKNYYYLFNLLRQPKKRRLHITQLQGFIDCYYNSNTVSAVHKILSSGYAGIVFDLQFTIVDKFIAEVLSDDDATKALISDDSRYYLTEKI